MMYRYKDGNGQSVYSDRPPAAWEVSSSVEVIKNGVVVSSGPARKDSHAQAKGYIKDARKHIPKALVYVEYIEYLRKMNPARYTAYVRELAKSDPKSHANLLKAGLFQPLKAHQRLSNLMDAGVMTVGDLFAGRSGYAGAVTLAEKTLVDYMKKDGFSPPDVLGSKASTLPRTVPQYSTTRLGQWSKMQDVRAAKAAKQAQAALAGRPVLAAGAKAATRVGGPVIDAMIGAIDPNVFAGASALIGVNRIKTALQKKGVSLDLEEVDAIRRHLANGNIEAAKNVAREATLRSGK